jgi:tetratricopeptide (TPR) repeat protein
MRSQNGPPPSPTSQPPVPPLDENVLAALSSGYALPDSRPWQMLLRRLELNLGFTFHTIITPDVYGVEIARRTLEAWAAARRLSFHTLLVREEDPPETLTLTLLEHLPPGIGVLWVQADGPAPGQNPDSFLQKVWHPAAAILNSRRNLLQRQLPIPLILAGPEHLQIILRENAPDLWSIRASVTYLDPPKGNSLSTGVQSPMAASEEISGDPEFTLAEAAKLEGQPEHALQHAALLHRAGVQFRRKHQWAQSERCLLRAWQLREDFHADSADRWATLYELGILFDEAGNYQRAGHYSRQAHELAVLAFGSQHPDTLASRNNLALALYSQAKYAEAEAENRAVLAMRERVLGPEHPDTLMSRMNLASALDDQGKNAEAEAENRAVWQIQERVLGAEHPDTLSIRNNLAGALYAQGKYAESEQEQRAMLKLQDRVLGAEHPSSLSSRMNLAIVLRAQGKNAEAEQELRAVLKLQDRVLGTEHPNVAVSCYNLALCLEDQKKLPEALAFMQRAEQIRTKVLGPDHPYTKNAKTWLERIEAALKAK